MRPDVLGVTLWRNFEARGGEVDKMSREVRETNVKALKALVPRREVMK